ncbi:hypothetical protein [Polyangium spumosum]|uniref:Uncharacterized protein n=1 Tax=Polyangium spumosum TaxID=889282 RepID=A0A6N7PVQ9_9BACT|nr:hypothetical protein [Polyangium spumosum]MRG95999.1 hypothetical protein [Polyangium spumosum]
MIQPNSAQAILLVQALEDAIKTCGLADTARAFQTTPRMLKTLIKTREFTSQQMELAVTLQLLPPEEGP